LPQAAERGGRKLERHRPPILILVGELQLDGTTSAVTQRPLLRGGAGAEMRTIP